MSNVGLYDREELDKGNNNMYWYKEKKNQFRITSRSNEQCRIGHKMYS